MNGLTEQKKRGGRPALPVGEKRDQRIELRATKTEREQLEQLCEQGNLTMTTLLLDGALNGLANLPQFQQIPPAAAQQLTSLQQVAGRLFSYAHRLDQDERTQQQVRQLVHELSRLGENLRQQLEQSALPRQLIGQLKKLRHSLDDPYAHISPQADHGQQVLSLIDDVLLAYEKKEDAA